MLKPLSQRRINIARGLTAHKPSTRMKLIQDWIDEGFDVSSIDSIPTSSLQVITPNNQLKNCGITFVTSLSPRRIRRHINCVSTWQKFGIEVRCLQTTDEIEQFQPLFPKVNFIETNDVIRSRVRIRRLIQEATTSPIMIVNADLELYGDQQTFKDDWQQPGLGLGYRWNYDKIDYCVQEEWGIDVLKVDPEMVDVVSGEFECALGSPGWDWLLPALMESKGFELFRVNTPQFFHHNHKPTWTKKDSAETQRRLADRYGITVNQMRDVASKGRTSGVANVTF